MTKQVRTIELRYSAPVEDRRVTLAISSEEPVERGRMREVLVHSIKAIDLEFLNSGRAPVLLDHDPGKQIGVVESVTLDERNGVLRAHVRFGKSAQASDVLTDIQDGIRQNVST